LWNTTAFEAHGENVFTKIADFAQKGQVSGESALKQAPYAAQCMLG
jgi:hypothetical protein